MKTHNYYLALKPIIDQTLFGRADIDDYFNKEKKLIFSNLFINYHAQFIDDPMEDKHEWLLMVLFEYFQEASPSVRKDIVDVIMDNELIVQSIIFMFSLNEVKQLDMEQCSDDFILGLKKFLDDGKLSPEMGHFFLLHFRNFEDIKPSEHVNSEIDKSEYNKLISQYLKKQTNFKFT